MTVDFKLRRTNFVGRHGVQNFTLFARSVTPLFIMTKLLCKCCRCDREEKFKEKKDAQYAGWKIDGVQVKENEYYWVCEKCNKGNS